MPIIYKQIYIFNTTPIKILTVCLGTFKLTLEFKWKYKGLRVTIILIMKNRVEGLALSNFKTYCRLTMIKTLWYCHKNRNTDQWERVESSKMNFHRNKIWSEMNLWSIHLWQRSQHNSMRKEVFSINGVQSTGYSHIKE